MDKRTRLQKLLEVFDPARGTSVDFTEFDMEVKKLKDALQEKIQGRTIEDVNSQLEKFKKKINLSPLLEAMVNLEKTLDLKIKGISGLMSSELGTLKKLQASGEESAGEKISSVASNLELLKQEHAFLIDQKAKELSDLKISLDKLVEEVNKIEKYDDKVLKKEVKDLVDELEKVRKDFYNRLANLGGGAMNRQELFNSVDYLTKYTDINWKAGANVTFTVVNNNATKRVDITIAATGGSGSGIVRSIQSISADQTADSAATTDYVYICTSTLTLTMPTCVGNSNLYTIKNTGTGTVIVNFAGAETGDNQLTLVLPVRYTSIDLSSDGVSNWQIT